METITVKMGARGQIVVPKTVRDSLGVGEGDTLLLVVNGDTVTMRARPESFTDAMCGLHADVWEGSEGWLQEERDSWD